MARKKPKKTEPLDPWTGSCKKPIKLRHLGDGKVYELHFDLKANKIKAKPFQWKGKQRILADLTEVVAEFNIENYWVKNLRYERNHGNEEKELSE